MLELEPCKCPFCGEIPNVDKHSVKEYFMVSCWNPSCPCMPETNWFDMKEEAIEAWNRRADKV